MQKPEHLDRDRLIPLDAAIAEEFAKDLTNVFASERFSSLLSEIHREEIAAIISELPQLPFIATVKNQAIDLVFTPQESPKLKALSDGVTDLYQSVIRTFREKKIMPQNEQSLMAIISTAFQPALLKAYSSSGMPEGPHTGYINRGC